MTGPVLTLHPASGVPIYRQLVDALTARINSGQLPAGAQLPTVRELSQQMGISVGTIKRVYDELERTGLVEKAQGRGTFVRPQADTDSRKAQAMAAIDQLLARLEAMDFSLAEIRIYLDLKLRDRAAHRENLKVALVDCNPEVLAQLTRQLRGMEEVDLYPHLLRELESYPYQLAGGMDLILTTVEHADAVAEMTGQPKKIAKVALSLDPKCVARILKLQPGSRVGILCASRRFGQLLEGFCRTYVDSLDAAPPAAFAEVADPVAFLADKDAVLLPSGYEKFASARMLEALQAFRDGHLLIPCTYQADRGSLLYARERMERLLAQKRGALQNA